MLAMPSSGSSPWGRLATHMLIRVHTQPMPPVLGEYVLGGFPTGDPDTTV